MKELIMSAAISMFAKYGYKKTTIDDIANELKMSKGNMYRYFINKEDLYHQAVTSVLDGWRNHVQQKVGLVEDPLEKFRVMAEVAIHYPEKNKDFCNIVLQDPEIFSISPKQDNYRPSNEPAEQMLKSILKQAVDRGVFRELNIDYTAELLFSVYMMYLIRIYGSGEGERGIELYMYSADLILNGLKK
ncbi:MAG: TetR/AcrR family transcriptional regulator [Oscillospiraceae bacterium]|nr:TetR/AcrR family transcriptional regulator [Oscillospiraceae bacterium]